MTKEDMKEVLQERLECLAEDINGIIDLVVNDRESYNSQKALEKDLDYVIQSAYKLKAITKEINKL